MGKEGLSIEVTERKIDGKRRVTLPSISGFKEGSKIVIIASSGSAIMASNRQIAENLAEVLHELEAKRKQLALKEWERLVTEAGLSSMSSEKIDQAVGRKIQRSKRIDANEATHSG